MNYLRQKYISMLMALGKDKEMREIIVDRDINVGNELNQYFVELGLDDFSNCNIRTIFCDPEKFNYIRYHFVAMTLIKNYAFSGSTVTIYGTPAFRINKNKTDVTTKNTSSSQDFILRQGDVLQIYEY